MALVPCSDEEDDDWERIADAKRASAMLNRFPPVNNNDEIACTAPEIDECSKCGAVAWHGVTWREHPFAVIVGSKPKSS